MPAVASATTRPSAVVLAIPWGLLDERATTAACKRARRPQLVPELLPKPWLLHPFVFLSRNRPSELEAQSAVEPESRAPGSEPIFQRPQASAAPAAGLTNGLRSIASERRATPDTTDACIWDRVPFPCQGPSSCAPDQNDF